MSLAGPVRAAAQGAASSPLTEANQLVAEASQLAVRGDTAAALERLERATKLAPDLADAHYRRGLLLAHKAGTGGSDMFLRRAAGNELERALQIDRSNPLYMLELGRLRLKQGFMRLEAERFFSHALDAAHERGDPALIAETEAELGDVYFRRYEAVANRRLVMGNGLPFDPNEALTDPHYAHDFLTQLSTPIPDAGELDLRQAEQHFRGGVAAMPGNDAAEAGLLGILYDGERYEEFLDAAHSYVRAVPNSSRAQLYYGLGLWKAHREAEAARAFTRAVTLMTPAERAHVNDLSVILRKSEAEQYNALSGAQKAEFDRVYWSANDPLRLTPENEHWLEHMARTAYTDIRYSAPDLKLRGWETDRGVIYIRYGPPPVIAGFPPASEGGDNEMTGKVVTVWYYPERNLRFVFYGPPGYNFARFAGEFQAYAEDARYAEPVKYDNVPVDEALDSIAVQPASFRPPRDSIAAGSTATQLILFAGMPLKQMSEGVDLASGPLQSGFFITDRLEREIVARRQTETVHFQAENQFETRTFIADIRPGEYRYRVEALQPATRRAARGMARVSVAAFTGASVMLSDVVLAHRVVPKEDHPTDLSDFFLDPSADLRFDPGAPISLYWETYGLTPDSTGVVKFRVDVKVQVQSVERHGFGASIIGGVLDAVGASAKGDDEVSLRYGGNEVLGDRDRIPGWLTLDLAGAPNGAYTLNLAITDLVSGHTATRQRSFTISDTAAPGAR